MTVTVPLPVTDAIAAVDAWFEGLGRHYLGKLSADDPFLAAKGKSGWRISTKRNELIVTVDAAFPFSRPNCYLANKQGAIPHVERDGKLCLRNPELPGDPVGAVAATVGLARKLLADIAIGDEDDDFLEDFGLYWAQGCSGPSSRLLGLTGAPSARGAWIAAEDAFYGFADRTAAERWWRHRFGRDAAKVRRLAIVALDALPHPDNYPETAFDLWQLIDRRSNDGAAVLRECLDQYPKALLLTLTGSAPSGRPHAASLLLTRKVDNRNLPMKRRAVVGARSGRGLPIERLCDGFDVKRLKTEALDAAGSRLPYVERDQLARSQVAVIGCGALGSGVARLLAKSGVGCLTLVDPDAMGWENIRRHQLGAGFVGHNKAKALAMAIAHENPDILSVEPHAVNVQTLLERDPSWLSKMDLAVACTANWAANAAIDHHVGLHGGPACIFTWMEAHALASHAVLITPDKTFASGYDAAGNPPMMASTSERVAPAECGGLTTPFGAIELAHAEGLTARLAMDFLRGKSTKPEWRTWLTDAASLADSQGRWTQEWISSRGEPSPMGQIVSAEWP
ncbi:MAG: ThiF family adenylyltransferase [Bosea sp. (in: a-proteobacteria)]|uniref:HesA/MoeB/ThiF family protein n=1 Tax=Bosea sp. (in: a-proteobacteria) TaxID=1871050 RepID=UPI00273352D3|nr:ThiF family adenylyltransferase [Bosea sp. (in: a-proteobacteria)]MDP3603011.1 ThiF family adenylyltransferase [Bosea sp. (in: a-proteobacteria)]